MNFKPESFPVLILISFILYAVFPRFESALVLMAAFLFQGFTKWLEEKRTDEIAKIREELKATNAKIEQMQLSRAIGR